MHVAYRSADRRRSVWITAFVLSLAGLAQLAAGQVESVTIVAPQPLPSLQPLHDFRDADVKFNLQRLMNLLRDQNHEGWVLAAYPDPNTRLPLIGAGFSLAVAATEHPQLDPLNPNQFLEPSSEQLWGAAGLDLGRLREILEEFDRDMAAWGVKGYRRKIRAHSLRPQLTDQQATQLLRISVIQATVNARAYCRNFDQLNGPGQMALTQLAFQMGVNLEEFVEFLSELNGDTSHTDLSRPSGSNPTLAEHWENVQATLIQSQWARRYTTRAISVIAMFDPQYGSSPSTAEAKVMVVLPLPVPQKRRGHPTVRRPLHAKTSVDRHPHHQIANQ